MDPAVMLLESLSNAPLSPIKDSPEVPNAPSDAACRSPITAIRHNTHLKAFEKKRAIAEFVINDFKARGRLIRTNSHDVYFFNKITKCLENMNDLEFRAALHNRFGLNRTEVEARFVEEELLTQTLCHGDRTSVHRLAYWNPSTHKLYVSMNNGTMLVLNGHNIEQKANGTDGVLFLVDRRAEPIQPDLAAHNQYFDELFTDLSLMVSAEEVQRMLALLKVWFFSMFFLELLPVRPIPILIGPQGSGKTTLGRRMGSVFYGHHFQVGAFRSDQTGEQDFLAAVCAKRFVVFDNADARIRWLPDHLARLATGAEIERRKLYTTNTLETFSPECFMVITSRDPRWNRDDVAARLLPIQMEKISTGKVPEAELQRRISASRLCAATTNAERGRGPLWFGCRASNGREPGTGRGAEEFSARRRRDSRWCCPGSPLRSRPSKQKCEASQAGVAFSPALPRRIRAVPFYVPTHDGASVSYRAVRSSAPSRLSLSYRKGRVTRAL